MRHILVVLASAGFALAQLPKPNAAGVAMGHLHLRVKDPEAHKKVWVDTLGGKLVKAGPLELVMFPDVLLAFAKGDPSGGTDDSIVNHLGFKVKDLASTKAKLTGAGLQIVREMPETKQAFIMFPDGVKVEFSEDAAMAVPIAHHHIHFFTHQVDEMQAWYAKHFSAVPGMRARFKAADVPGVNLTFSPNEKPTIPSKGRGVDHIGFEIAGLEAFCKKLEADGIKLTTAYRKVPALGISIAFLNDPWGATIELTEGFDKLK